MGVLFKQCRTKGSQSFQEENFIESQTDLEPEHISPIDTISNPEAEDRGVDFAVDNDEGCSSNKAGNDNEAQEIQEIDTMHWFDPDMRGVFN